MKVYLKAFRGDTEVAWCALTDTLEYDDTITADEGMVTIGANVEWVLTDGDGAELTERVSRHGGSPRLSFTRAYYPTT